MHIESGLVGRRAAERSALLARVSGLLGAEAFKLSPVEMLTCICGAMATHLSLSNVVFWKRVAGQSRTLVWSAHNDGRSPMLARRASMDARRRARRARGTAA